MVFRLPTPLESWIPPPNEQLPQSRPWRGTISIQGMNIFQRPDGQQLLNVMAAETQGDNRAELWPRHLSFHITSHACRLTDAQRWVSLNKPDLCMFMPDRLPDPGARASNEANFRSLSQMLMQQQAVAIAPWNAPDRLPGSGILLLPIPSSTALLVGVIFLSERFPELLVPSRVPSGMQQPYPVGQGPPVFAQNLFPSPSGTNPAIYGNARQQSSSRYYQQQIQGGMPSYQGQSYPIAASIHAVPHPISSSSSSSMFLSDPDVHVSQTQPNWPIIIRIGDEGEEEPVTVEEASPPLPSIHEGAAP